jgi:hypothetical protein
MPFAPDAAPSAPSIEFRAYGQMLQKDRDLAADAESSIAEHAGHMDLEFNQGKWSDTQVVCPALPNHLFLQFTRNSGTGDVSVFTASIPRGGEGRVWIIPILLRGYSLFSPAPINKLTIAAFNRIRAEEPEDGNPDWLGTGLCYAALAGGHPEAALPGEIPEGGKNALAMPPTLEIPTRGGAVVRFTSVSAQRPMEWSMIFDGKGRLLKATHAPASEATVKEQRPQEVNLEGKPLPPTYSGPQ